MMLVFQCSFLTLVLWATENCIILEYGLFMQTMIDHDML